jgi:hypothetical protein
MRAATSFTTGDPEALGPEGRARGGRRGRRGSRQPPRLGPIRANSAASPTWSCDPEVGAPRRGCASPTGSPPTAAYSRTGCPGTPSKRRCCWRWAKCACLVPRRRSSESWGCRPTSPGGAASTASSSAAASDKACPPQRRKPASAVLGHARSHRRCAAGCCRSREAASARAALLPRASRPPSRFVAQADRPSRGRRPRNGRSA